MSSSADRLSRPAHPWLPHWVIRGPPETWDLTKVVNHVKTAMLIELTTIPLYLYAAYSIDVEADHYSDSDDAKQAADVKGKIIGVALQEMLHLALSGNLLCALDSSMDLYDFRIIPQFPGTILFEPGIEMSLNRANKENLTDFKNIEHPDHLRYLQFSSAKPAEPTQGLLPDYFSIGDFYDNLKKGLKTLSDNHLNNNPDYQFSPQDFPGPLFDGIAVIKDQKIAQNALELIIEQGEGGPEIKSDNSHYAIFKALSEYPDPPPWKMYDVGKNPKTIDYLNHGDPKSFAYTVSLAFDAGYCYLLQSIQRVWGRGGGGTFLHNHLVGNMLGIMKCVMPVLTDVLVHQQLSPGCVASPCFNYYPAKHDGTPETPLEPEDLHSQFLKLVNDAAGVADKFKLTSEAEKLSSIATIIEKLTPYP